MGSPLSSHFPPRFWSFHENLLCKNLSSKSLAECSLLYYNVIMNYYETYMMAINIADDGDHERNAKHHAFWQISMFQKFGKTFAQGIGDVHRRGRPGTADDNRL